MSTYIQLNRIAYALLLFLLPTIVLAKKDASLKVQDIANERKSEFSQQKIIFPFEINKEQVAQYIKNNWKVYSSDHSGLDFISEKHSPGGIHFAYRQTILDIPVYNTYLKVNFDQEKHIRSTFNNAYDISNIDMLKLMEAINMMDKVSLEEKVKSLYPEEVIFHKSELILYFHSEAEAPIPYLSMDYEWAEQFAIERILINAESEVIHTFDLKVHAEESIMTEVPASVFLPDPLTTAGVVYGGAYSDQNDMAVDELNAEQDTVTIDVMIDGAWYVLESDYVKLSDLEAPAIDPIDSPIPSFYYGREDDGFEQVNCYYHLNFFKEYLNSLDFDSIHTVPVIVDPHGVNGDDNSYFSSNSGPPRLVFGEGCVDDAEDADVIIHENGHHISWSAAPGSNSGFERRAMDEGIGDYWAASYSRAISEFDWDKIFTWDGHNTCWDGRSADLDIHYPEDINSSIHSSGQIWSTVMMNIWEDLGKTVTDRLMMQANFNFAVDMQMPNAASLVLQADSILYGGIHSMIIMKNMYEVGLMPLYVFAGPDRQKCPTEIRNLGSTQPQYANVSYSWDPAQGLSTADMPQVETTVDVSTTYTLTVTDMISGASTSDEVLVFVYFCEVGIEDGQGIGISLVNSFGFSFQDQAAVISLDGIDEVQLQLYDLNGKCLVDKAIKDGFELHPNDLNSGIYILNMQTEEIQFSAKLVKN